MAARSKWVFPNAAIGEGREATAIETTAALVRVVVRVSLWLKDATVKARESTCCALGRGGHCDAATRLPT